MRPIGQCMAKIGLNSHRTQYSLTVPEYKITFEHNPVVLKI